jgi:alpha-tubulin suppressor-like RCC1 family protein
LLVGCGRFGFDSNPTGDGGGGDGGDGGPPGPPVAIATGDEFTCAIARGAISCWGGGNSGQLGGGISQTVATPMPGPAIANPIELDGGVDHMCALDAAGAMSCWGDNKHGQLAQPSAVNNSNTPFAITGLPAPVQHLAVGGDHTCAILSDASMWCWGANANGQVGIDPATTSPVRTPQHVLDGVASAALGDDVTCAVKSDQSVWCWGIDAEGELGDGLGVDRFTPMPISGLVASQVSCGDKHCCALVAGGHYSCWGYNNDGELGDTTVTTKTTPNPPSTAGGFARLEAGNDHMCALGTDGSVSCWGVNYESELGDGVPAKYVTSPVSPQTTGPFVALAGGGHQSCAIRADGSVACWGDGSAGQIGDGTLSEWSPKQVTLPGAATAVAAGTLHTCAVVGGVPYCWGSNWFGEIGDGSSTGNRPTPVAVTSLPTIADIALGAYHTCARTSTGAIYCWGANSGGQLGDGTTTKRTTPVLSMMAGAQRISAGGEYTCGANSTDVQCWGYDDVGEIGDNGVGGSIKKTPVSLGIANAISLGAGGTHACAVSAQLTCWGDNESGEIGIGTTSPMEPQRQVTGSWVTVVAGGGHTCAKATGGAVSCWGDNGSGQLGDGTRTEKDAPIMVTVPGSNPDLELGDRHSCASTTTGLYCWGGGTHGSIGDGTGHDRSTATAVPGFTGGNKAAAGSEFTCAIDGAGAVWCWGDNSRGQLGLGTVSVAATPVEVTLP